MLFEVTITGETMRNRKIKKLIKAKKTETNAKGGHDIPFRSFLGTYAISTFPTLM